jgi:HSP20 family protein
MRRNDRGIVSGGVMFNDFVRNLLPDLPDRMWRDVIPETKMNVKIEDDAVKVQFTAPGCKIEDFDVESSGSFLTVKVAKRSKTPKEEGNNHYTCVERSWEEYQESVKLPVNVVPSEAKAKYVNGILEITLPRSVSGKECKKQIQVNS